ncbi:hypothetical protein ACJX0J_000873 [Zea mays]
MTYTMLGIIDFFFEIHFEKEWIRMKRMLAYSRPSSTSSRPIFLGFNRDSLRLLMTGRNQEITPYIKQFHRMSMTVCVIASTIPGISMNPILAIAQDTLF